MGTSPGEDSRPDWGQLLPPLWMVERTTQSVNSTDVVLPELSRESAITASARVSKSHDGLHMSALSLSHPGGLELRNVTREAKQTAQTPSAASSCRRKPFVHRDNRTVDQESGVRVSV
jgi:hypothetical protein